jgi:hypothetical protein
MQLQLFSNCGMDGLGLIRDSKIRLEVLATILTLSLNPSLSHT